MRRNFLELERDWFKKLLTPDFPDKGIIEEQLKYGYVIDMDVRTSWVSVGLGTDYQVPFPHDTNVPVIMDVHQKDGTFIGFMIILNNGFINEFAIYHIAGYDIPDYGAITFEQVSYEVNL